MNNETKKKLSLGFGMLAGAGAIASTLNSNKDIHGLYGKILIRSYALTKGSIVMILGAAVGAVLTNWDVKVEKKEEVKEKPDYDMYGWAKGDPEAHKEPLADSLVETLTWLSLNMRYKGATVEEIDAINVLIDDVDANGIPKNIDWNFISKMATKYINDSEQEGEPNA